MTTYEWSSLLVMAISALFVGISLLYLSRQIKLFIASHEDNHEWNRRIATSDALSRVREINTDLLNEVFAYLDRREPVPLQEVQDAFKAQPNLQPSLHKLLNLYEGLANGVYLGTYDETTIRANRESAMIKGLAKFRPYIQYRRDCGSKTAWSGYERLVNKWLSEGVEMHDKNQTGRI